MKNFVTLARSYLPIMESEEKMNYVSAILQVKGKKVFTVSENTPLLDALELMANKRIGAVLVMDGEKIAGIFSERDFARKVAQTKQIDLKMPIKELMTREVFVISPEDTLDECMAVMSTTRIRHLPVVDEGKLVGLISIGDVVQFSIEDKDLQIQNMEKYIFGYGYGQ